MTHFKPITALNKIVSSKRGSLEKGSGDVFLPYPSKTNFNGRPYNPLEAAYSFEQNGFILMTVLRGRPLGHIFALSLQKYIFPDPIWVTITMMMMLTMWRNQNKG